MVVNLTNEQYYQIMDLLYGVKLERGAYLESDIIDNEVFVKSIIPVKDEEIKESSKKNIVISNEYFVRQMIDVIYQNKKVCVNLHTHPNFRSAASFSKADSDFIIEWQQLFDRVKENFPDKPEITYIEGIVTNSGINFFYYDKCTNKINRCTLKIDGVIKGDADKKGFLESLKDGFNLGRNRAK